MRIQNTSEFKTMYISLSIIEEPEEKFIEIGPKDIKDYDSQVGVMMLNIKEKGDGIKWSGIVPTQIQESLMLGYGIDPYVTYSGQLIPNILNSNQRTSWLIILILAILVIIIAIVMYIKS